MDSLPGAFEETNSSRIRLVWDHLTHTLLTVAPRRQCDLLLIDSEGDAHGIACLRHRTSQVPASVPSPTKPIFADGQEYLSDVLV